MRHSYVHFIKAIWWEHAVMLAIGISFGRLVLLRRAAWEIVSQPGAEHPTLQEVRERLSLVNEESNLCTFTAIRRANLRFGSRYLCLFYGTSGSQITRSLFAVATAEEVPWFQENADLFTPAALGHDYAVFWVRTAKLRKELALES